MILQPLLQILKQILNHGVLRTERKLRYPIGKLFQLLHEHPMLFLLFFDSAIAHLFHQLLFMCKVHRRVILQPL